MAQQWAQCGSSAGLFCIGAHLGNVDTDHQDLNPLTLYPHIRAFALLAYFRLLPYALGIFSICWGIMIVLVCSFQCRPLQLIWDQTVDGTCINASLFFILGSAPNVITDFVILVLPLPAVWRLQTTTMQKISLTGIFLLGSL